MSAIAEEVMVAVQEELGDLKLYRIPEPVTVAANSQKQVALLVQPSVRVQSVFRARTGTRPLGEVASASRYLITRNRKEEGLGLPLPSGGLVLFTDRRGQPFLAGSGRIEDRAVGEDVEIDLGPAPGITFRIDQVETSPVKGGTEYILTATSDRPRPIRFEAEIQVPENSRIARGPRLTERDGLRIWSATIPANGTTTLRYRFESLGKR
jgi:hypothetical protein